MDNQVSLGYDSSAEVARDGMPLAFSVHSADRWSQQTLYKVILVRPSDFKALSGQCLIPQGNEFSAYAGPFLICGIG